MWRIKRVGRRRLSRIAIGFSLATTSFAGALDAAPTPATIFADHAIFQRDRPLNVWGKAEPSEHVDVTFAGRTASAIADANGAWRVTLEPLPASASPRAMTIAGGGKTVTVSDVLVGDVWLCSGQSNMAFTLAQADRAPEEIAAATDPLVRMYRVKNALARESARDAAGYWQIESPKTAGQFTAVGYFFARAIRREVDVPIALLNVTWGGTRIESWIAADALRASPALAFVDQRWQKTLDDFPTLRAKYDADAADWDKQAAAAKATSQPFTRMHPRAPAERGGPPVVDEPSAIFNAMVAPTLPYAVRGVLWYQGESNVDVASDYHPLFAAMISDWRARIGEPTLPFFWVQLPNYVYGGADKTDAAVLRDGQNACLALPDTGQAVTIDVGNPANIHPTNKQAVGDRLARLALHRVYGKSDVVDVGPTMRAVAFDGLRARISFAPADLSGADGPIAEFALAGVDKIFHAATATIDGETILVSSDAVTKPVAVRYAWRNAPKVNLFNAAGLPAVPFRTDDW